MKQDTSVILKRVTQEAHVKLPWHQKLIKNYLIPELFLHSGKKGATQMQSLINSSLSGYRNTR